MKKVLLLLGLLLTGCSTAWHVSTVGHDPIYDTVLEVPADVQINTLNYRQLQWKLRTDFQFRYDFAQYALSQPRSFDWNNRILGNRYNLYNPYWGYSYSWNRDMMWYDWVWGYPYSNWRWNNWNHWNRPYWGWNNHYYGWNNWGWRNQMNNYAWQHRNRPNTVRINSRRDNIQFSRRVATTNTRSRRTSPTLKPTIIQNTKPRIRTKPRINYNTKPVIINRRPPNTNNSRPTFNNSRPVINNNSRPNNNNRTRGNSNRKN